MLSLLPFAKILVNRTQAARRIAARITSEFVLRGNLTPMTHEALCYACMVGIVMPTHHDITPMLSVSLSTPARSPLKNERFIAQHMTYDRIARGIPRIRQDPDEQQAPTMNQIDLHVGHVIPLCPAVVV